MSGCEIANPCSFGVSNDNFCGPSRGFEEFVRLNSCNDDISVHLSNCHLSREVVSEKELILARSGFLDLDDSQIDKMVICPKHRHSLGKFWRPSKSCQYPSHSGGKNTVTGSHVFNFKLMREVRTVFGQAVPVGSRRFP